MKIPPFRKTSVANFKACNESSIWLYESNAQFVPTLGAPSFRTTSALKCFSSFFIRARHLGVVMSHWKVTQPLIAGIWSRSTPILILAIGMYLAQTYSLHKQIRVFFNQLTILQVQRTDQPRISLDWGNRTSCLIGLVWRLLLIWNLTPLPGSNTYQDVPFLT